MQTTGTLCVPQTCPNGFGTRLEVKSDALKVSEEGIKEGGV